MTAMIITFKHNGKPKTMQCKSIDFVDEGRCAIVCYGAMNKCFTIYDFNGLTISDPDTNVYKVLIEGWRESLEFARSTQNKDAVAKVLDMIAEAIEII